MNEHKKLRILSISTDRDIFREGSEAEGRMKDLGSIVEELHIIVFTKGFKFLKKRQVSSNVWAYPTNSLSRWFYIFGAYALAKKLFLLPREDLSPFLSNIDLITTQDPFECGLAGYFISKKLHAPLHFQIHTDFLNENFRTQSLLNRIRVIIAKFLLRGRANIRVVSERIKFSILEKMFYGKQLSPRIITLPVFVDVTRFKETPETRFLSEKYPGHSLLILVVSRLEKEKNVGLAIRLVAETRKRSSDSRIGMVIAGSGSEEKSLRSLVKRLKLKDHVFFEGKVNNLAPYYKSADLLFVTSLYEGYGRMFLEAFASGCPVITHDVGAAKDILGNTNGIVCDEADELCLIHNLSVLSKEPASLDQLKHSARASAEHFTPKTKEQYLSEYRDMLEKASARDEFFPVH
ncbi:MAG: glycosyltransferase [Candidatus Parcubacteria bacterium]|nr:glycosyltransferase [Candidatus Parcubacteria bacterium]